MSDFLVIIPARFGSKGIPYKNLLSINGKNLIEHAFHSAQKTNLNLEIVVSSDSEIILNKAEEIGSIVHRRPKELSNDSSETIDAVNSVLGDLRKSPKYVIVLQPTSPFRNHIHVSEAIDLVLSRECDGVISVYKEDKEILKSFIKNKDGYIQGVNDSDYPFMPRQNLPEVYRANGAIFIVKYSVIKSKNKLYGEKMLPYLMDKDSSLDINTLDDLDGINYKLYKAE